MRLEGRTAIVSGGSRGIGAAIARRLAVEGADVALTYVGNADAAGRVVSAIEAVGRKAVAIKADSSDPTASGRTVEQATDTLGPLDIIVHSAGVSEFIDIAEASVARLRRCLPAPLRGQRRRRRGADSGCAPAYA